MWIAPRWRFDDRAPTDFLRRYEMGSLADTLRRGERSAARRRLANVAALPELRWTSSQPSQAMLRNFVAVDYPRLQHGSRRSREAPPRKASRVQVAAPHRLSESKDNCSRPRSRSRRLAVGCAEAAGRAPRRRRSDVGLRHLLRGQAALGGAVLPLAKPGEIGRGRNSPDDISSNQHGTSASLPCRQAEARRARDRRNTRARVHPHRSAIARTGDGSGCSHRTSSHPWEEV